MAIVGGVYLKMFFSFFSCLLNVELLENPKCQKEIITIVRTPSSQRPLLRFWQISLQRFFKISQGMKKYKNSIINTCVPALQLKKYAVTYIIEVSFHYICIPSFTDKRSCQASLDAYCFYLVDVARFYSFVPQEFRREIRGS